MIDGEDADGRQHERTSLAWLRTALAAWAVGLFMVRQAESGAERWLVGTAAAVALLAILATVRERTARLAMRTLVVAPAGRANVIVLGSLVVLIAAGLVLAV